jgi:hypothetical protein
MRSSGALRGPYRSRHVGPGGCAVTTVVASTSSCTSRRRGTSAIPSMLASNRACARSAALHGGLVPELHADSALGLSRRLPRIPPGGRGSIHARRYAQHPSVDPEPVLRSCPPRRGKRLLDLLAVAPRHDRHEVLRLPDRHLPGEVTDQDVDAPVPWVRRDHASIRRSGSKELGEHVFEFSSRTGLISGTELVRDKADRRLTRRHPGHRRYLTSTKPSAPRKGHPPTGYGRGEHFRSDYASQFGRRPVPAAVRQAAAAGRLHPASTFPPRAASYVVRRIGPKRCVSDRT